MMINVLKSLTLMVALVVSACNGGKHKNLDDGIYADLETQKGEILIRLEYEKVPITVANFISLAEGTNPFVDERFKGKKFYDGLRFHRVVDDFVIQGGDPRNNGSGDPGYKFEDEFPMDEAGDLLLSHDGPGVLSMANSGPDSNGSQFFITHKETPFLDGKHSVFGRVISGQEVVDSIVPNDKIESIEIIRVGRKAKKFDATEEFSTYFASIEERARLAEEERARKKQEFVNFVKEKEASAQTTPSGLKIIPIQKGRDERPVAGTKVLVNYAGYFSTGDLFDSNVKEIAELYGKYDRRRDQMGGYRPVPMDYSPDAALIPGFREGLQMMNYGDKLMLLIPSHLAYGEQGSRGVIPPNADLIFELEIVDEKP